MGRLARIANGLSLGLVDHIGDRRLVARDGGPNYAMVEA